MHGASSSTQHGPADGLVGRGPFLDYVARLIAPTSPVRVLLLHGNAGIGKTALGTAIAGRWEAAGGTVKPVTVAELRTTARQAAPGAPRLLVVDADASALPTSGLDWFSLLFSLRSQDRLLILSRVAVALPLDDAHVAQRRIGGLGGDDADLLLARHGVALNRRTALAQWAAGSPLHLVLGAHALAQHGTWDPATMSAPLDLQEELTGRLAGAAYLARRAGETPVDLSRAQLRILAEDARRDDEAADQLERRLPTQAASASARPRLDVMPSLS